MTFGFKLSLISSQLIAIFKLRSISQRNKNISDNTILYNNSQIIHLNWFKTEPI